MDEQTLRRTLFEQTGGMYPELVTRPNNTGHVNIPANILAQYGPTSRPFDQDVYFGNGESLIAQIPYIVAFSMFGVIGALGFLLATAWMHVVTGRMTHRLLPGAFWKFAAGQAPEDVFDHVRVRVELADVTADVFLLCIAEQIKFGEHDISLAPPYRRVSLREGARKLVDEDRARNPAAPVPRLAA